MSFIEHRDRILKERGYTKLKDAMGYTEKEDIIAYGKFEQWSDTCRRVADFVGKHEDKEIRIAFEQMLYNLDALPNSPCIVNAGTDRPQLSACLVAPIDDSIEGIYGTLHKCAKATQFGYGIGASFSRLRPKGDLVRGLHGNIASGPVSFMGDFNQMIESLVQGGTRKGGCMGILRVDHPSIEHFITCKDEDGILSNFNISVGITHDFMGALIEERDYALINPRTGEVDHYESAQKIWNMIVHQAWKNGEPGLFFIDTVNDSDPTRHINGNVESPNLCSEVFLKPWMACVLGSINLSNHYNKRTGSPDWDRLRETVFTMVRFLDDVIDTQIYPFEEIEKATKSERRIGLGVMGFADLLVMCGIRYGSEESVELAKRIMENIQSDSSEASLKLTRERGPYPIAGDDCVKYRNSCRNACAPTGTISIIAGVSSGIEPIFAIAYKRRSIEGEFNVVHPLFEEIAKEKGFYSNRVIKDIIENNGRVTGVSDVPVHVQSLFRTAGEIGLNEHIEILAAFQKHTDMGVSKTLNAPFETTPEEVDVAFREAYRKGIKGITFYRDGSRGNQTISVGTNEETEDDSAYQVEVEFRPEITPRDHPDIALGSTYKIKTGCGKMYVHINEDNLGPCAVFAQLGKAGGCAGAQTEATTRLISLALRCGIRPHQIVDQLIGISCPNPCWNGGGEQVMSCADGIAKALKKHGNRNLTTDKWDTIAENHNLFEGENNNEKHEDKYMSEMLRCPECGSAVQNEGKCKTCYNCGWNKCGG